MTGIRTCIKGIVVPALFLLGGEAATALQISSGPGVEVRPPQPTNVQAVHYSGQTFLTWSEGSVLRDESYRVYRSTLIIQNVREPQVEDLHHETWENSGEFYADRVWSDEPCKVGVLDCGRPNKPMECFRPRYVKRFWIPDGVGGAREVPDGEGLLVWTPGCEDFPSEQCTGWVWYAVTTVDSDGHENPFVTAENRIRVYEGFGEPLPIEVPREYLDCSKPGYCPRDNAADANPIPPGVHVLIQYMDLRAWNPTFHAPNFTNCWWGEDPSQIHVQNNRQYAYTYVVSEPDPAFAPCSSELTPLVLDLHHHADDSLGPNWGIAGSTAYADGACAIKLIPHDVGDTWWFGFVDEFDYRAPIQGPCSSMTCAVASPPFPPASPFPQMPKTGNVVNYTEARVLRMIYDLGRMQLPPYQMDPDRIYVQGTSMGGSGAIQLTTRYPNIFAAGACAKPITDYEEYLVGNPPPKPTADSRHELPVRWGPYPDLAGENELTFIGIENTGPGKWAEHLAIWDGTSVWEWMDLINQIKEPLRQGDDSAPIGVVSGFKDKIVPYPTQGLPFFQQVGGWGDLGRTWGGKITCLGHNGPIHEGMPPSLSYSATNPNPAPFSDYNVRRAETTPGFMNLTGGHYLAPPVNCCSAPCVPQGPNLYYHDLIWSSSWYDWDTQAGPPVDLPNRWAVSLKWTGSFTPPPTVDVVPRRLQNFVVKSGVSYQWMNIELGSNVVIQSPGVSIQPSPTGILRLPDVQLTPPGNRVIVFPEL